VSELTPFYGTIIQLVITVPDSLARSAFWGSSWCRSFECCLKTIVVDPWHFGTDPHPWIRTTDIRIRILLFSSVADKMPTKTKFFSRVFCLLHFEGTCTSVLNSPKKSENSRNQWYSSLFCLLMQGSGFVQNHDGSGSGRSKNIRIRIHNTALKTVESQAYHGIGID
jgi:hypothetical protein